MKLFEDMLIIVPVHRPSKRETSVSKILLSTKVSQKMLKDKYDEGRAGKQDVHKRRFAAA